MSISKKAQAAAPQGSTSSNLSTADLDPQDPQHEAKVTAIETIAGNKGNFDVVHIEITSPELRGKTLTSYADRIHGSEQLKVGSKLVANLGTNNNGYPDLVGGKRKNYIL